MKRIIIGLCVLIVLIGIGLIPQHTVYKDGGTETLSAIFYKKINWNKLQEDGTYYTKEELIFFPNNFKSLDAYYPESERIQHKKKIIPQLQVDFNCPKFEHTGIESKILAWKNSIKQETEAELQESGELANQAPLLAFSFKQYNFHGINSIIYFVEKNIYKGQPEHSMKAFYFDSAGKQIQTKDILNYKNHKDNLADMLEKGLTEKKNVFPGDIQAAIQKYVEEPAIYVADKKIGFIFDRNSGVAPYSAGVIELEIPLEELQDMLNTTYFPKEEKQIITKNLETYTIQKGDTISKIGRKFNIEPERIIASNNIKNPSTITVGQKIKIPKTNNDTQKVANKNTPTPKKQVTEPAKKYVALTFDDGPHKTNTPRLLEILKKHNVRATFYVIGKNVKYYPEILKQEVAAGHEIGSHSWNHPNFLKINQKQIQEEISTTDTIIKETVGIVPTTFRPPYGAYNDTTVNLVGKTFIMWSVDTKDWKYRNVASNLQHMRKDLQPGAIILFHDIHKTSVDTIDPLIKELKGKGYSFVTVSELLTIYRGKNIEKICYSGQNCKNKK